MSALLPSATASPDAAVAAPALSSSPRIASVDALRGFVMLLMMAEVLRLARVAQALPESGLWQFLAAQQTHVEWVGASLHDLIQPGFSFLVGVALPFSIASRLAAGKTPAQLVGHALWRALVLVLLGVFLRSVGRPSTNWTFEDTLSQIGLGYGVLFWLGLRSPRVQWFAFGGVLVATWAAFAAWPLPAADFDHARVGVPPEWLAVHGLAGFEAHWQKNSNLAWAFDVWLLNLFPRAKPFLFNGGGYATLSFVPTLGTMILGLAAGRVLRREIPPAAKVRWLVVAGLAGIAGGAALDWLGICPVVKRIWTPSWVLASGGACLLLLAGFYAVIDGRGWRRWAFPLLVIGANSIAAYLIAQLFEGFIAKSLQAHVGRAAFRVFGAAYEPLLLGAGVLAIMWLLLFWMFRRKIFLKI